MSARITLATTAFSIIQTFFISAISGGLFEALAGIAENPASIVDLLATTLPEQSTYFIQILTAGTVVMVGIELLRVVPLIQALIRSCVGPRLTEKEQQTTFMGLRPLSDPLEFQHSDVFAVVVLYFMVLLVYAVIAPLTSFVAAFCFLYMGAAYRHQFVYVYPSQPDSGGRLWLNCVKILLICMFVAELVIAGLLGLKKAGAAAILMIPLLIIQLLFNTYVGQQHFRVPANLPSRVSMKADLQNRDLDLSFLDRAYVQPELQKKEVLPEGLSESQEMLLGFSSGELLDGTKMSETEAEVVVPSEMPSESSAFEEEL